MTSVKKTGAPVGEIPIQGFSLNSEDAKSVYRDETVEERDQFERDFGYYPENCEEEFLFGDNRGLCTRPQGHFVRGDNGMHLAGDGNFIVGAW